MIPIIERKMIKPINDTYRTVTVRVVEPEAPRLNIVYFHRFGGESLEFLSPAQELASVGCRVSAMEYLGHTASEWLPKDDYAPTHDVQFARTLLAAQEGDLPLLIIANGWGCHVALQAMSAAAHAPAGAVLFDYVNAFNYNTDIVMPFDAAVARIVAESLPEFERELKRLAQPLGAHLISHADQDCLARFVANSHRSADIRVLIHVSQCLHAFMLRKYAINDTFPHFGKRKFSCQCEHFICNFPSCS